MSAQEDGSIQRLVKRFKVSTFMVKPIDPPVSSPSSEDWTSRPESGGCGLQRVLIAATRVQGQTTGYSHGRHGYGEIQARSRNSAETILVANHVVVTIASRRLLGPCGNGAW